METANIHDAKSRLSQRVGRAAAGEDVVVSRNGKPLARTTQLQNSRRTVKLGVLKGQVKLVPDFNAPLPADVLAAIDASGFIELGVSGAHAACVARLPLHHADPFDRLLVAQSLTETLRLLAADAALAPYGQTVLLV